VTNVRWQTWGGPKAFATGMSWYVGPGQDVPHGTEESAVVVAFDLGDCQGQLAYRAIEWYFPQHGGKFDPSTYRDICTGSEYVDGREIP